ncbi:PLDc N-terminal domain-containing protein [Thiomicrorhabdus arctica]|uniref:PLDc N-terminal domain-containing protein n=1 Tax=Thiomicrorhabdus arctica TaxID=131540 RepID=UPI000A02BB9D|nr:PLDc N-terminal domain-containing protein [Thiomicrorhabdus arctica]
MLTTTLGILHLIIAVWAILSIFKSGASTLSKIIWALIVLIFPIVGLIIWFVAGPKP